MCGSREREFARSIGAAQCVSGEFRAASQPPPLEATALQYAIHKSERAWWVMS